MRLEDSAPDGEGDLRISTVVEPAAITNGKVLLQDISFDLNHATSLAVGTAVTFDGRSLFASYGEETYDWNGIALMNGVKVSWYTKGGRIEVVARSGSSITLKLTNVSMSSENGSLAPFALSGTISGTIETPS